MSDLSSWPPAVQKSEMWNMSINRLSYFMGLPVAEHNDENLKRRINLLGCAPCRRPEVGGKNEMLRSENLQFSDFRHFCRNVNFLGGCLRIPSVEKVASDPAQLFRRGFPVIFYVDSFSS